MPERLRITVEVIEGGIMDGEPIRVIQSHGMIVPKTALAGRRAAASVQETIERLTVSGG